MKFKKTTTKFVGLTLGWFIRWRRPILIFSFVVLIFSEVVETISTGGTHWIELIVYFVLFLVIALLIELLLRENRLQTRTSQILDFKHQIRREFFTFENWESFTARITEKLGRLANVGYAELFIKDPVSDEFASISRWQESESSIKPNVSPACLECLKQMQGVKVNFGPCACPAAGTIPSEFKEYFLPVYSGQEIYAMVRFILEPGQDIKPEQAKVLKRLDDEVALALISGQDRKRLSELRVTQAILAERHSVSQYLHDSLSQNIGYLKMKLERFSADPALLEHETVANDLVHMREVADESYLIVRGKLESIHSDTLPTLTNYLREHAQKISQRAGFAFSLEVYGNPHPIPMDVQRAVYYVFQEILANAEKHAKASQVNAILEWEYDTLALSVSDNGIGFDSALVEKQKHFGLGIVRERIENVNGDLQISSSAETGTQVKMIVPIPPSQKGE